MATNTPPITVETPENQRQIDLVEYQKTQESAEHHDRLLWGAVGLLTTGMAPLLAVASHKQDSTLARFYPPVLGMILSVLLIYFVWSFGTIRLKKYERCKQLELKHKMQQHNSTPRTGQRWVVYTLSGLSFVAWLLRLCWQCHAN
jgi:hypothetical protein